GNEEEEPGRLNSGLRVHFTLLWTVFAWLEQPNNVLSDTDVALSNIAGYCAKTRVTNSPCPPVPLPPSRHTGVSQEASRQRSPSRPGADHSIVRRTDVSVWV